MDKEAFERMYREAPKRCASTLHYSADATPRLELIENVALFVMEQIEAESGCRIDVYCEWSGFSGLLKDIVKNHVAFEVHEPFKQVRVYHRLGGITLHVVRLPGCDRERPEMLVVGSNKEGQAASLRITHFATS